MTVAEQAQRLPNFLIVGAAKSGTTSLYYYLKQHPEIYLPENKEPRFFVSAVFGNLNRKDPRFREIYESITVFTFEEYKKLFSQCRDERAIGEASVQYLYYHSLAIPEIKRYLGDIKILIILRNPVDRAHSAFMHLCKDQVESLSFEQGLEIEDQRKRENWSMLYYYKDLGFYFKQVQSYMENFEHVKICMYEDLKDDPIKLVKDVCSFLGVDTGYSPEVRRRYNISGIPKNKFIQNFLSQPNSLKRAIKPFINLFISEEKLADFVHYIAGKNLERRTMNHETRKYLRAEYREDILKLQDLIKKDLSGWLA